MTAISFSTEFNNALPIFASPLVETAMIVVPCYNEARRLKNEEFINFLDMAPRVKIVFVDDGSTDATLETLYQIHQARSEQVDVISLPKNEGKHEAVRQGLLHASQTGAGYVGYWDADLATPLDALHDFLRVIDKFQSVMVVFGSRKTLIGHRIKRSLARRSVSRICAIMARQATRLPIGDTQCGAKLLRNNKKLRRAITKPFTAGWLFDVELFSRISAQKIDRQKAFYELPLAEWSEVEGSSVSARAIVSSGIQMLKIIATAKLGLATGVANLNEAPIPKPYSAAPEKSRLRA